MHWLRARSGLLGPYSGGPGLASHGGHLYDFWDQNGAVTYSKFNGTTWSTPSTIVSSSALGAPPPAVRSKTLYVAWENNTNILHYRTSKGSTWTSAVVIPSTAEGGPALAGYSTKLYAAWDGPPTGSGSFTIDYAAGP